MAGLQPYVDRTSDLICWRSKLIVRRATDRVLLILQDGRAIVVRFQPTQLVLPLTTRLSSLISLWQLQLGPGLVGRDGGVRPKVQRRTVGQQGARLQYGGRSGGNPVRTLPRKR